ncbi:PadR family transcriptional regulator [Clostridium sp. BJN0001]|uniref:PadR family transcriptional regulator n=1 Tax=Clostridium sp. BJN0001 TaxID=2930219 RepID=UPI001FD58453|nr:PadR family transcriptional regulator [Clostridium sp. BJN0001]
MVKLIILYYLNIKSTHGYEIQKFMQATGLDEWAKIKSGSIYYALNKMEKEGQVELLKEETLDSKVRKIYGITEKGKKELKECIKEELSQPLMPISIDKFILPITFKRLDKEDGYTIISKHIEELNKKLDYWKYLRTIKITDQSLKTEKISFDMIINVIEDSIRWHKALMEEYDEHIKCSVEEEKIIRNTDFDKASNDNKKNTSLDENKISELKNIILSDSHNSKKALEKLISMMKN